MDLFGGRARSSNRWKLQGEYKKRKYVNITYMERNDNKVANFNRKVTLPGFSNALSELKIKVDLWVKFADGMTRTLIDSWYKFDLQENS